MKSRIILIGLLFFCFLCSKGNITSVVDTFSIDKVEITNHRNCFYSDDINIYKIDSSIRQTFSSLTLGDFLTNYSNIHIHGNGKSGFVSGSFIRGTNSYQTSVNWNGFSLNSTTLGTYDLSLINSGLIQDISVNHGASASLYGSGTFGGAIDLNNMPDWKNKLSVNLSGSITNINEYINLIGFKIGNKTIQSHSNFHIHRGDLKFPYNDPVTDNTLYQIHNRLNSITFMQNIFLKLKDNKISCGIWYSEKYKEIPSILASNTTNYDIQQDSTLKAFIKWRKIFSKSSLSVNTAYFYDYQKFSEYPEIKSVKIITDIFYRYFLTNQIVFDLGGMYVENQANSDYYQGKIREPQGALLCGIRIDYLKLTSNITFRKEIHAQYNVKPLIGLNLKYNLIEDRLFVKSTFSRNFRVPTINDKYWVPGGNPDLLPENGWSGDAGFQYNLKNILNHSYSIKLVYYSSVINDMIQWIPLGNSALWVPKNSKQVWARGLESSFIAKIQMNSFEIQSRIDYSFSKSTVTKIYEGSSNLLNKQLRYLPLHSAKGILEVKYRNFSILCNELFTGNRYTDEENIDVFKLPGFFITNIIFGFTQKYKQYTGKLSVKIDNLFNTDYQLVRAYPMPLRTYAINYKMEFNY